MGFRNDLDAARLRVDALSDENRVLRDEIKRLKKKPPPAKSAAANPAMEALAEETLERLERLSYEPPERAEETGLIPLTPIEPSELPERPKLLAPPIMDEQALDAELRERAARAHGFLIAPVSQASLLPPQVLPEPPRWSFASGVAVGVLLGGLIGFVVGLLVMR